MTYTTSTTMTCSTTGLTTVTDANVLTESSSQTNQPNNICENVFSSKTLAVIKNDESQNAKINSIFTESMITGLSFESLPNEIVFRVVIFINGDYNSFNALAFTCKKMCSFALSIPLLDRVAMTKKYYEGLFQAEQKAIYERLVLLEGHMDQVNEKKQQMFRILELQEVVVERQVAVLEADEENVAAVRTTLSAVNEARSAVSEALSTTTYDELDELKQMRVFDSFDLDPSSCVSSSHEADNLWFLGGQVLLLSKELENLLDEHATFVQMSDDDILIGGTFYEAQQKIINVDAFASKEANKMNDLYFELGEK